MSDGRDMHALGRHSPTVPLSRIVSLLGGLIALSTSALASSAARPSRPAVAGEQSVTDGTQAVVPALPGWEGGNLRPFVDPFSGNLLIECDLLDAEALGPDWAVAIYYNSTLSGVSGIPGPGWRHSYEIALRTVRFGEHNFRGTG